VMEDLAARGEQSYLIGEVVQGEGGVGYI